MAVLGNIRKRTGLTIVVIGFAMLAFLVVDMFSGNSTLFGADPNNLGSVDGNKITMTDYNAYQRTINQNNQISENQRENQIWDNIVRAKIAQNQADELGLELPPFQTAAILFGKESPEEAKAYLEELKGKAQAGDQQAAQIYQNWLNVSEIMPANVMLQQYIGLVSAGAQATNLDANWLAEGNKSATIEYAFVSYQDLETKNKIEVTDEEIEQYIKKHPKQYQRPALVDLHYVYFPAEPSAKDDSVAFNYINQFTKTSYIKNNEGEVTDTIPAFINASNDSLYVMENSIDAPYTNRYFSYQELASNKELQDFVSTAPIGAVKGPYKTQNAYFLSKLIGKKNIDSVLSSHILIPFVADSLSNTESLTKTQAKTLADSISTAIQSGANFASLALQHSKDGSAQNGGDLGWKTTENSNFVQPFNDFIFSRPKDAVGVVETQFGYHVIKVNDKKSGLGYKIANLAKQIEVSEKTNEAQYNAMNNFYSKIEGKPLNEFVKVATEQDLNYNNADNVERYAPQLGYLGTDQDAKILAWAFSEDTKAGTANKNFTTSDGGTVVAFLANRYKKGLASPASARQEVEPIIKQQKIYDLVNKKSTNLTKEQLVKEYGAVKENGTITFATANLQGKGIEQKVAGAVFGLKPNKTSKLIQGKAGLYMVTPLSFTKPNLPEDKTQLTNNISNQMAQQIATQLIPSFKNNLDIKDNRSEVFKAAN